MRALLLRSVGGLVVGAAWMVGCGGGDGGDAFTSAPAGGSAGAGGGSAGSAAAGKAGSGTAGKGSSGSGTAGSGTAGTGTAGTGTAGKGTAGSGTAGTGTAGSGTAGKGTAGSGTAGSGTAGKGAAGSGTAGTGTAGSGTAGSGTSGSGTAGSGTAGSGTAGSGTAGSGTAGSGTAGSGTAGSGTAGSGTAGSGTAGSSSGCAPDGSACMSANGNGICTSSMCGDCAADSECQTAYSASSFCFSGSCEVCDAVGTDYIVDPVNGNDATATGSGTAGGGKTAGRCAFKTVTAAIKAINGNPGGAKLTITVLGASTLTGETYPLVIPQQTTLTTSGGDVQVTPAGDISNIFTLGVPGASIDGGANIINLVGSGLTGASNRGINVVSGCDDACIIRQFHVTDTGGAAVSVGGTGRATMLEGVQINKVGRGNNTRNCVLVGDGAAFLTIKVAAGQAQTIVNNCSGVGIGVYVNAGLAVAGEVDFTQPDKSSIVVANSGSPGLVIQQAINGSTPQLCTIDGLATVLNGLQPASQFGASGMRLQLGSNVRVRNSASVANKNHGVHVVAAAGGPAIGTLSIDLGNAASPGLNVFQATGVPNAGVGICFSPGTGALKLPAQGNTFFAADCSMTNASLTHSDGPNGCSGAHDVGVNSGAVGTAIDVSMCN